MLAGILNRHIYQDENDKVGNLLLNLGSVEQIERVGKRNVKMNRRDIEPTENDLADKACFLRTLLSSVDDLNNHSISLESLKVCFYFDKFNKSFTPVFSSVTPRGGRVFDPEMYWVAPEFLQINPPLRNCFTNSAT